MKVQKIFMQVQCKYTWNQLRKYDCKRLDARKLKGCINHDVHGTCVN